MEAGIEFPEGIVSFYVERVVEKNTPEEKTREDNRINKLREQAVL